MNFFIWRGDTRQIKSHLSCLKAFFPWIRAADKAHGSVPGGKEFMIRSPSPDRIIKKMSSVISVSLW